MTRIRAIGFSLNAFSAKLRRLLFSYRIAGIGILLPLLLLSSLLIASCAPSVTITGTLNTYSHKQIEMENVRFEPQELSGDIPTIQPARAYWLKRGDKIAPKWDTFEWHWEHQSAMMTCNFRDNTSSANCQICNYCNPPSSTNGPPCMGFFPPSVVGNLRIVADRGFVEAGNPDIILDYVNSDTLLRTCSNTQNPLVITPPMSGLYRFWGINFKYNFVGGTEGEAKIHIVEPGESSAQTTPYPLTRQTVNGVDFWTWTVEGDPFWLENFSPNLRVSSIRIFRGNCADGSAQGKQCAIPNEGVLVKPSRILFLPDFYNPNINPFSGESEHRCYLNPNADPMLGNFISLDNCRKRCDAAPGSTVCASTQIERKHATPAYEWFPARPTEKLTWLVEFNTNEGADADLMTPNPDPMPQDAVLIIEFTIQAD